MDSREAPPKRFFGHGLPYHPLDSMKGRLIVIEGTDGVGRSTQARMIRDWLEVRGHAVVETGWTRSMLLGDAIARAKEGHSLNPLTFGLIYASDFADRLENEVIPALRSGAIVVADRYLYTAIARNVVRGLDPAWVKNLFGYAIVPDIVFYLKIGVADLVPRVLHGRRLNYWEAGVDMGLGSDLYDSFLKYQNLLISRFDAMAEEYGFHSLDATEDPYQLHKQIRRVICERVLEVEEDEEEESDGR